MMNEPQQVRTLVLSDDEWSALDTAIPDTIEILNDVANVLFTLSYEADLDQPGVNSMLRLAARAVQSMEGKEVAALERLDFAIRHSTHGGQS